MSIISISEDVTDIYRVIEENQTDDYIYDKKDFSSLFHTFFFMSTLNGLFNDIRYNLNALINSVDHSENYSSYIEDKVEDPEALCVLLHGLYGHPSAFDNYHDAFKEKYGDKITIYQPHVINYGNCSIEDATDEIAQEILNWSLKHENMPIVFIGSSNGARISAYISTILKQECGVTNPMKVTSIAGPFFGSTLADQPNLSSFWQGIWKYTLINRTGLINEAIIDELSWNSDKAKDIIDRMRQASESQEPSENQEASESQAICFDLYATTGDEVINDFTSSLPVVHNANHFVVKDQGHNSIIGFIQDHSVDRCIAFIESFK